MRNVLRSTFVVLVIGSSLAGCGSPYNSGDRAVSGGLIGGAGGAAVGGLAGGGTGALIGGGAGALGGAAVGAATTPTPHSSYSSGSYGSGYRSSRY